VLGFLGVALGAFGAHGLRSRLSPEMLAVFETGVRYQMYHVFALLIVAAAIGQIGAARSAHDSRLVLPRRHPVLFGKPVRPRPDGHGHPRGHHSHRRPVVPVRLGLPGVLRGRPVTVLFRRMIGATQAR